MHVYKLSADSPEIRCLPSNLRYNKAQLPILACHHTSTPTHLRQFGPYSVLTQLIGKPTVARLVGISLGCRFCGLWIRLISSVCELYLDWLSICNTAGGQSVSKYANMEIQVLLLIQFLCWPVLYNVYAYAYLYTWIQVSIAKNKGIKPKVILVFFSEKKAALGNFSHLMSKEWFLDWNYPHSTVRIATFLRSAGNYVELP